MTDQPTDPIEAAKKVCEAQTRYLNDQTVFPGYAEDVDNAIEELRAAIAAYHAALPSRDGLLRDRVSRALDSFLGAGLLHSEKINAILVAVAPYTDPIEVRLATARSEERERCAKALDDRHQVTLAAAIRALGDVEAKDGG